MFSDLFCVRISVLFFQWIHCFENVTSVLFVAAISEYDQKLFEDESCNRMSEALSLFEEIVNSRWYVLSVCCGCCCCCYCFLCVLHVLLPCVSLDPSLIPIYVLCAYYVRQVQGHVCHFVFEQEGFVRRQDSKVAHHRVPRVCRL